MATGWDLTADTRRAFADMVEPLTPEQLSQETLCAGWTAKEVAGHLVSFVDQGLGPFFLSIAKAGFNFDKAADAGAKARASQPIAELAATLRAKATQPAPMKSFPAGVTTFDVAVHTQDIRRPLGLAGELPAETLKAALTFITTDKKANLFVKPKALAALRFEATDIDWSWGTGAVVRGPAEALMMALAGRDVFDELEGDGVADARSALL